MRSKLLYLLVTTPAERANKTRPGKRLSLSQTLARPLYVATLLGLLFVLGCPTNKKPNIAQALPQVQVQTLTGKPVSLLSITQGKVAVVDLWATWCGPCKETLPKLERLSKAYGPSGLLVVGVDVGEEDKAAAQQFALAVPANYPMYFDPGFAFVDSLGSTKVPTLLVVDRSGRIVHRSGSLDEVTLQKIRTELAK